MKTTIWINVYIAIVLMLILGCSENIEKNPKVDKELVEEVVSGIVERDRREKRIKVERERIMSNPENNSLNSTMPISLKKSSNGLGLILEKEVFFKNIEDEQKFMDFITNRHITKTLKPFGEMAQYCEFKLINHGFFMEVKLYAKDELVNKYVIDKASCKKDVKFIEAYKKKYH